MSGSPIIRLGWVSSALPAGARFSAGLGLGRSPGGDAQVSQPVRPRTEKKDKERVKFVRLTRWTLKLGSTKETRKEKKRSVCSVLSREKKNDFASYQNVRYF